MPDAMCKPCEVRGRTRVAERLVDGVDSEGARIRIPKCASCYEQNVPVALADFEKQPAPDVHVLFPRAEAIPAMSRPRPQGARVGKKGFQMRTDVDWKAVQADRNKGMKLREIEKKYGVSTPTICAHTDPRPGSAYAKASPPASKTKPIRVGPHETKTAVPANGLKFSYVALEQVPVRHCQTSANAFAVALATALLACPAGKALAFPVPPFSAKTQNPQGSIRGALTRALAFAKQDLRFFVAVEKDQAWVWPRAENPSKGKAR